MRRLAPGRMIKEPRWASEAARRQLDAGESDSGEWPCCSDLERRRCPTHTADPGARSCEVLEDRDPKYFTRVGRVSLGRFRDQRLGCVPSNEYHQVVVLNVWHERRQPSRWTEARPLPLGLCLASAPRRRPSTWHWTSSSTPSASARTSRHTNARHRRRTRSHWHHLSILVASATTPIGKLCTATSSRDRRRAPGRGLARRSGQDPSRHRPHPRSLGTAPPLG